MRYGPPRRCRRRGPYRGSPSSATGASQGIAEDQAGPVVEGVVDGGLARIPLGGAVSPVGAGADRGLVANQAGEPASRSELGGAFQTHRVSFLEFVEFLTQE